MAPMLFNYYNVLMAAPVESTLNPQPKELALYGSLFVPAVPLTGNLAVWRMKETAALDPDYLRRSVLFSQVMTTARDKIGTVLPATINEQAQAVLMDKSEIERVRTAAGLPNGVTGFIKNGRYIYNPDGQMATTEGGFEALSPDKKRAAVHELTHVLKGMGNLPYWMGEGFCEAVPRFLLGYHHELQTTPYLQEQFEQELVDAKKLDEAQSLFAFSTKFPFGENRGYMSALAYVLGLSTHLGNGDVNRGLMSFYDTVHNSSSPHQLRQELDKISSAFVTGDTYAMMDQMQRKGVDTLKESR